MSAFRGEPSLRRVPHRGVSKQHNPVMVLANEAFSMPQTLLQALPMSEAAYFCPQCWELGPGKVEAQRCKQLARGHTANRPAPDGLSHLLLLGSPDGLWKWGGSASKGEESQRNFKNLGLKEEVGRCLKERKKHHGAPRAEGACHVPGDVGAGMSRGGRGMERQPGPDKEAVLKEG